MIRLRHDPQAWAAFWRKVQGVTEAQRVILAELGVLIELDAGIAHSVAKVFPGRQIDLTPAGFDAALLRREAELIGRTGLR